MSIEEQLADIQRRLSRIEVMIMPIGPLPEKQPQYPLLSKSEIKELRTAVARVCLKQ